MPQKNIPKIIRNNSVIPSDSTEILDWLAKEETLKYLPEFSHISHIVITKKESLGDGVCSVTFKDTYREEMVRVVTLFNSDNSFLTDEILAIFKFLKEPILVFILLQDDEELINTIKQQNKKFGEKHKAVACTPMAFNVNDLDSLIIFRPISTDCELSPVVIDIS
jgi:hypothetical protein